MVPTGAAADPTDGSARADAGERGAPLIAVWGPTGAPGRTTLAVALAGAFVALGQPRTLLVDADLGRGTVAAHLGEEPGGALSSACALRAPPGQPCAPGHLRRPRRAGPWLLAGLTLPEQWPEVAPARLGRLLDDLRAHYAPLVVDLGAALPPDPRGEGHLVALRASTRILAVCAASVVGVQDFLLQFRRLEEVLGEEGRGRVGVILNHVEPGDVPRYRRQVEGPLNVPVVAHVPHDHASVRHALTTRRPLTQDSPRAPASVALLRLATHILSDGG